LTFAAALQSFLIGTESDTPAFWENTFDFTMRPRYDVDAYELTYAACCGRTGVGGRLNGADISANEYRHVTGADIFLPDQLHIRGLYHRVSGFDGADKSLGFDHAQSF